MRVIIDEDVIAKSIETYGKEKQSVVCMEECAELIQCISKEFSVSVRNSEESQTQTTWQKR